VRLLEIVRRQIAREISSYAIGDSRQMFRLNTDIVFKPNVAP
jgi:hypothetical protein